MSEQPERIDQDIEALTESVSRAAEAVRKLAEETGKLGQVAESLSQLQRVYRNLAHREARMIRGRGWVHRARGRQIH